MAEILWIVMTIMALGLAGWSVRISREANKIAEKANEIAKQSDKKMTAIADSQIDEKLAIMATHRGAISRAICSKDNIQRFKNDFNALYDLKSYTSKGKEKELLENYIKPILAMLQYHFDIHTKLDPLAIPCGREWKKAFEEIKKTAKKYGIETETIRKTPKYKELKDAS